LSPDFKLHPSIYAVKSLLVYHHIYNRTSKHHDSLNFDHIFKLKYEKTEQDEEKTDLISKTIPQNDQFQDNDNSDETLTDFINSPTFNSSNGSSNHLSDPKLTLINPLWTGIAFYVDLHGHAAKRGCFIYGNCIDNELYQVENVLFTKLIAFNSQHFDFEGCNFTLKNMYMRDKRDTTSKEGAGRVAIYKQLGIIHSYTLECCYASGRVMNTISPAVNCSRNGGTVSPPLHSDLPPKFIPEHYQDVGKAVAIAALDIIEENPLTRVPNTSFGNLEAVRNWIKCLIRTKPSNISSTSSTTNGPSTSTSTSSNSNKSTSKKSIFTNSKSFQQTKSSNLTFHLTF
jgi:cytosolic carboxypeptidase protein 5